MLQGRKTLHKCQCLTTASSPNESYFLLFPHPFSMTFGSRPRSERDPIRASSPQRTLYVKPNLENGWNVDFGAIHVVNWRIARKMTTTDV